MLKRYMWSISIQLVIQVPCGLDKMGKMGKQTIIREKQQ